MKRREVLNLAKKIRSERLRENQHIEGYGRCHESKRVEWD